MNRDLGIAERLRRNGRPPRTSVVATRFTKEEAELITKAAAQRGVTPREWARDVMLRAACTTPTDRAVFTELTALRLLMTNVLRPLALGETLTAKDFQAITAGVRKDKHDAAQQLLAQYQPSQTER